MVNLKRDRDAMVARQLAARGITDPRVLAAMRRVPRERFVPDASRHLAYADSALPIDCGQTISQPYIVALMTQALELSGDERVLEVGTGCGYQTALLAELAADVYTIERHADLSRAARRRLESLGYRGIHYRVGDGTEGWPEEAPFDRIIVTAAAENLPPALWEQLEEGGIVVAPLGGQWSQRLVVLRKIRGEPIEEFLCACRFVPLVAESGGSDSRDRPKPRDGGAARP